MIYDVIDYRKTPAKKITMGYDGDAVELAREFTAGDRMVHFPASDDNGGAVVRWFGTYSPALTVKPARVIEENDTLQELYEKAKKKEREAFRIFVEANGIEETEKAIEEWTAAHYYYAGIIAAIHAVKRFDILGVSE